MRGLGLSDLKRALCPIGMSVPLIWSQESQVSRGNSSQFSTKVLQIIQVGI